MFKFMKKQKLVNGQYDEYPVEIEDKRKESEGFTRQTITKSNKTVYSMKNRDLKPSELDNFATCNFRFNESGTCVELGAYINVDMSDDELINLFKQKLIDFSSMEIKLYRKDE